MATDKDTGEDLGTQGAKNTIKGKAKQAGGTVQKKAGQVTGDKSMQAKGKAREVEGKVQSKAGKAEQKVDAELNEDV